jgi:glutamate synthase domain-containing protein 3
MLEFSAKNMSHRELNFALRQLVLSGEREIRVCGVCGHRYLGTGLPGPASITVEGVPGEDLGAFLDGCLIRVLGNAQNFVGNTMNSGQLIVHGNAGDIVGYGMRGGSLWILGNVGYRAGIHMKASHSQTPVLIVGGRSEDFLGEYMAGGVIVVLGIGCEGSTRPVGNWVGAGMHGGTIYVRGNVPGHRVGKGAKLAPCQEEDLTQLEVLLAPYCREFGLNLAALLGDPFVKLVPASPRPYGRLYVSSVGEC